MTDKVICRIFSAIFAVIMIFSSVSVVSVSAESGSAVITCGDTTYTANVGDEVIYTVRLTVPGRTEDISGFITYNAEVLEIKDTPQAESMPNMLDGILVTAPKGEVYFNGSSRRGFNFNDNQILLALSFTVKNAGSCGINLEFTSICKPNNEEFVYDGIIASDDINYYETLGNTPEARVLEISHHGETYVANIGDEIIYTAYLSSPERITEVMAGIGYSLSFLTLVEENSKDMFPNIFVNSYEYISKRLQFAGTVMGDGFCSDKDEAFVRFRFKVVGEGKTSIDVFYDLFSESGECYMSDSDNGIKVTSVIISADEIDDTVKEILGDSNGNGEVNVKDATQIQKAAAKLLGLDLPSQLRADVNADGKVNVKDATAIQKYVAKIETGLDIGKPIN